MSATVAAERSELFGHPRGLATLFFTEMWERFSFYGMQALLVLFMTDQVGGGFGLDDQTATAIYGIYTAFVYLVALPGGWIADRLVGRPACDLHRRNHHHVRAFRARAAGHGCVLRRPDARRARHRVVEAERQRHRRRALCAERSAS